METYINKLSYDHKLISNLKRQFIVKCEKPYTFYLDEGHYFCPICPFKTSSPDQIRRHLSLNHTEEEIHKWGYFKKELF